MFGHIRRCPAQSAWSICRRTATTYDRVRGAGSTTRLWSISLRQPRWREGGMTLMLKAYFDDAGTHGGSPLAVMGGLIGTIAQWDKLEDRWGKQLANPLP